MKISHMTSFKMEDQGDTALLGTVLRAVGLTETEELQRFRRFFSDLSAVRFATAKQRQWYVAGSFKRRGLLAAIALGRRVQSAPRQLQGQILSSAQLGQVLMSDLTQLLQEQVDVISLDTKHQIIGRRTVFRGTLNSSPVHPREVFATAIAAGADKVVIAHNHPSGSAAPSKNDLRFMRRLVECGQLLGIELLDGMVIGQNQYFSLKEAGILTAEGWQGTPLPETVSN